MIKPFIRLLLGMRNMFLILNVLFFVIYFIFMLSRFLYETMLSGW